MKNILVFIIVFAFIQFGFSQKGRINGRITDQLGVIPFANISIKDSNIGDSSNGEGFFELEDIPMGKHVLIASFIGYETKEKELILTENNPVISINFELVPIHQSLEEVVITGTRTFKRKIDSPIIVNVISSETLGKVQACNLSEGLKFQPGLRVETDCQTCNYTQLRMNGLGGGYSQILINGRPIFSPLTGLYGMEQIPTNMIERIEVVRGGGSALYGSSAIGGTVNVITKIPKKSAFDLSITHQNIDGQSKDNLLNGNATVLNKKRNLGASFFINHRDRAFYDNNGDNFSELPEMKNNSFGANLFFQPSAQQKLEISLSSLHEYRFGGEMVDGAAHLALQSEERLHDVWMGSIDYQLNFNEENSSIIAYAAAQKTDRTHYTGIFPDETDEINAFLAAPPYGTSDNTTWQGGIQLNHRLHNFLGGSNVLTVGAEYMEDDVLDVISAYRYEIDQLTKNFGTFLQSDWSLTPNINFLAGLRADKHNLVDRVIVSPRLSLLYKLQQTTQFRLTWGTGFRAPQAFDADLHIAFAGGGISRISLDPDLVEERSNSFSASINYDKVTEKFIAGFTLEAFYTQLDNAFFQQPIGEDAFGERFEKQNGDGSVVKGTTIELRANYDQKAQLEAGFTLQSSLFDTPVDNIEGLEARRTFLRTPNHYGYATLSYFPDKRFNTTLNLVYTGTMEIAHFAGAPEQEVDAYKTTPDFLELGIKTGYTFLMKSSDTNIELFGGVKNLFNAYQNDFDTGKNRDSNYVYGPGLPRTFFVGVRLGS